MAETEKPKVETKEPEYTLDEAPVVKEQVSDDTGHDDEEQTEDQRLTEDQQGEGEDKESFEVRKTHNQIRRDRRRERHLRAQAQADAILQAQANRIAELEKRIKEIEGRGATNEMEQIDQRIGIAKQHLDVAVNQQTTAIKNKDDVLYHNSKKYELDAIEHLRQLEAYKQTLAATAERQKSTRTVPPVSIKAEQMANEWIAANDWFDKGGRNELSRVALQEDNKLRNEGYDPESRTYWAELSRRVERKSKDMDIDDDIAAKIPIRNNASSGNGASNSANGARRGPPVGGGSNTSSKKQQLPLAKERREALREHGVDVDDPKAIAPYLEEFAKFDRENKERK